MSNTKEILNSEEVEFLLEAGSPPASQESPDKPGSQQVVTMRGDLEQMHLADIFQTLGMAKMEGLLKISNPVDHRLVHFQDGEVRILVPPRSATRRLGQRLVQAGVLQPEQLRLALLEQRKQHAPLGEILVNGGYVPAEQIEDVVALQITEELFGLFTWEHGSFEFYRGPVEDPALLERLDNCPSFEVNSLLLEVARRADEWEDILGSLRSLDEIPLPVEGIETPDDLDEVHRSILLAVDGRMTYRELSEATVTSVFDCARAARDLMHMGMLAPCTDEHMLDVARWHFEQGQGKNALMIAHTLRDRPGERPIVVVREIASLVRSAGEARLAGSIVLQAAQLQSDAALALELAREACALNPRDLDALAFLRTSMLAQMPTDAPEIEQVTLDLLDGLLHDGDAERVLALCEEIGQLGSRTPPVMVREARALTKRKDNEAAIEVLLEAGAIYGERGDGARQLEVCELAFRLDRERKDVQRLVKQLRTSPRSRMVRWGAVAAAVLALAVCGGVWFAAEIRHQQLMQAGQEVSELLRQGDREGARSALARWRQKFGDGQHMDDLEQQVVFAEAAEAQRQRRAAMREASDQLQRAGTLVLAGELAEAFAIYTDMMRDADLRNEVVAAANARVEALTRDLGEAAKHLPQLLPDPPDDLSERRQVEDTLTMLRRRVPVRLRDAAAAILRQRDAGTLPEALSAEQRQSLVAAAEEALELLARGLELTSLYEEASLRFETQQRLDPLFKAAIDHERELRFAEALEAYQKLEAANAGDHRLLEHFRYKVRHLEGIVGACAKIEAATRAGDFATADREYRALRQAEPDIQFHQILRLPVTIRTSVPGARIRWEGKDVGTSPRLCSYSPGSRPIAEVSLARFRAEQRQLPAEHGGIFDVVLTLEPDWHTTLESGIEQPMALAEDDRVFATERSGKVLAIDCRGERILWQFTARDTASYLTRPVLHRDLVLVASLDGPLRALEARTGELAWQRAGLAAEFAPAMVDGRVALGTIAGELVLLEPRTGEQLASLRLPSPIRTDLAAAGRHVFLALADGTNLAIDVKDQTELWHSPPGEMGQTLLSTSAGLVAVRDDGLVQLVDPLRGAPRWQYQLPATPVGRPAADERMLLVTLDDRIVMLHLGDGSEAWSVRRSGASWQGPARFLGAQIAVPTRGDAILVFRRDSTEPRYQLAGDRDVSMCGDGSRYALVGSGRRLTIYRGLP